jgi:predicted DNA binding CopG/RHH family protein
MLSYDNQNLDVEELELEESFSNLKGRTLTPAQLAEENKKIKTYTVQKPEKKSISIRLLVSDIILIKSQAERMGIPYQTLIALEINKLANRDSYTHS